MVYFSLFIEFFKIGLFSVGGGMATLPFLYDLADKYPWFTKEMLVDMIAISESTPGPIGVNMATFAGYSAGGIIGGITATVAIITPSIFIMIIIAKGLETFQSNKYVKNAFYGLRPVVVALIVSAGIGIAGMTIMNYPMYQETGNIVDFFHYGMIFLFALIYSGSLVFKKLHPICLIGIAAVAGIILKL